MSFSAKVVKIWLDYRYRSYF